MAAPLFSSGKKKTKRRRRRSIRFFGRRIVTQRFAAFAVLLVVALVCTVLLANYGLDSMRRRKESSDLVQSYEQVFIHEETAQPSVSSAPTAQPVEPALLEKYHNLSGVLPEQAQSLYAQNSDLVGWIYIDGVVSLPVVYRNNDFYMNHDFNGRESAAGTLFLDEQHPLTEQTQHLLIHGHNMKDSSMFGIVSKYDNLLQVKNHGFARFSTLYAPENYVIFAVLNLRSEVDAPNYLPYMGTANFASEEDFYAFAETLKRRSLFDIPVDVQPSDALLSLSTCIDERRLLVVFRRMREGETRQQLQQLLNQTVKY